MSMENMRKGKEYYVQVTHRRITSTTVQKSAFMKKYRRINHVDDVKIIDGVPKATIDDIKIKTRRFIFDIDGVLVSKRFSRIPGLNRIFIDIKEKGDWFHFASGRSDGDVYDFIKWYDSQLQGIAENGGLVLLSRTLKEELGSRLKGPNQALACLKRQYGTKIREDMDQGSRITEIIIKTKINRKKLETCVKKHNTEMLAGRETYHIVQKNVNKGKALNWLSEGRNWDDDVLVAVGDSDLDVPMFKAKSVMLSFAVGNASPKAKNAADGVLEGEYLDGVREMLKKYFYY